MHLNKAKIRQRLPWETLLFFAPSIAFATNYNASDTASLISAINSINAGSGGGTITLTGNITLSSLLPAINESVTIEGQNYSLSGNNTYQILTVTGGQLSVVNASLIDGKAQGATGGAGGSNSITSASVGAGGGGGAGFSNGTGSNGGTGGASTSSGAPSGGGGGVGGGSGGSVSNGSSGAFGAGGGGGAGGNTFSSNGLTSGMYYTYYSGGSGGFGAGSGGAGGGSGYDYKGSNFEYSLGAAGGGGGGSLGAGGAVLVMGGSVSLQNVNLSGNSAVGGKGGAGGSTNFYGSGGQGGSGGSGLGGAIFVNSGTTISIVGGSIGSDSVAGGAGGTGGSSSDSYAGGSGYTGSAQGQDAYLYGGTLNYEVDLGTITAQIASTATKSTLTKTGSGILSLTAPGTNYFNLNLNGGTVSLGSSGAVSLSGSTISFGGGTLQFTGANTNDYSSEFSTATNQAYNLDPNGHTITLASNLTSSGGSLNNVGTGTIILTGNNTYSGGTTNGSGGTIIVGNGGTSGTLGSGAITNYGALEYNLTSNTTLNSTMSGTGLLLLQGSGTVTLTGSNTTQAVEVNNGTLAVGGGTSMSLGDGSLYVGYTGSTPSMMLISNGGLVTDNYAYIGSDTTTATGIVTVNGINANGKISTWNNSYLYVGFEGAGTLNVQNGALVTDLNGYVGLYAPGNATVDGTNNNGTASAWNNTSYFYVGYDSSGTLTVSNGGIVTAGVTNIGAFGTAGGTLNLNSGGVLQTSSVGANLGGGTSPTAINFNGGILRATASTASFVSGFTPGEITLESGGGTIDNNSYSVAIANAIGGIGALTSTGTGSLVLAASNSYGGGTTVGGGTLYANNANGSATGSGAVTVKANATLAGTGAIAPTSSSGSAVTVADQGNITPGGVQPAANYNYLMLGNNGPSNPANGSLTLDPTNVTGGTLLSVGAGTVANPSLTFALGNSVTGTGPYTVTHSSSEIIVVGTRANTINFDANGTGNSVVSINDLVGASLQLDTAYVLIQGNTKTTFEDNGAAWLNALSTGLEAFNGTASNLGDDTLYQITSGLSLLPAGTEGNFFSNWYGPSVLIYDASTDSIDIEVVPEPGTWGLLLGGLAVLILIQRRKTLRRR